MAESFHIMPWNVGDLTLVEFDDFAHVVEQREREHAEQANRAKQSRPRGKGAKARRG